jgi:hypothetical protein
LPDVARYGLIRESLEAIAMTTSFQDALKTGDLLALRAIPKSDLHNHAVLGGHRPLVSEWAGRDIAPLNRPLASMAEMDAWVEDQLGSLFSGPTGRLRGFEAAFVQAKYDGVTRLEVGEDVWAITLFEHDATKLTSELISVHTRVAPDIEWIAQLGLSRHCPISALTRWLAPFLELGIYRTLDLYGDEFAQPIERFRPLYRMAKSKGLRLKAHVGEWGSADDVWRAVEELELDEVQHGIAAAGSSAVMRMLADNDVRLNVCPTSNVMLGRVDRLETHPIRRLYDAGVKVTVNTDDVLVFGNGVSEEFLSLYQARVFSADELDGIRQAGLSE